MDSSMEHPQQSVRRGTIFSAETSDVRYDFCIITMFGSSLPPVVCRRAVLYLRYLCLFAYNGVHHVLRCVFVQEEEKQSKNNPEKLATYGTQDEDKQNKNNPEKLAT
jgi:hypothetical protein